MCSSVAQFEFLISLGLQLLLTLAKTACANNVAPTEPPNADGVRTICNFRQITHYYYYFYPRYQGSRGISDKNYYYYYYYYLFFMPSGVYYYAEAAQHITENKSIKYIPKIVESDTSKSIGIRLQLFHG